MPPLAYKRILLKLSGEALGARGQGINSKKITKVVSIIKAAKKLGVEIGIVVGGGNWWRKRDADKGIKAEVSDYMGMLGTVLNGMGLASYLDQAGVKTLLQAYLVRAPGIALVNGLGARRALGAGQVLILAGGTGKPFVTTDTAAANLARDIKADVIFKVGLVDGVYSSDPDKTRSAKKYLQLTYAAAIKKRLKIFDMGAYKICQRSKIPIVVFKLNQGNLLKALQGRAVGTVIN